MVILATGFDALTGALFKPDIRGRDGVLLRDKWGQGPLTHFGLGTAGFPNMLIVAGPGSPSVLSNVIVSIEEQVDWIVEMLTSLRTRGVTEFEVTAQAEKDWTDHVQERAQETLYMTADSFYNGGEVQGKPRVFMPYSGGIRMYRRLLNQCADQDYSGFALLTEPAGAHHDA